MYRIIFILFITRLNVYSILIITRVSINNYSILAIMRSISQIISFGVLIFLFLFITMIIIEDYKLINLIFYQTNLNFFISLYPLYFIFIIRLFIDLNRIPFYSIESISISFRF